MERTKTVVDRILPGRVDGLALVGVAICCLSSTWPWCFATDVFPAVSPLGVVGQASVVELALMFAAGSLGECVGFASLFGLWVIFGNQSVWHRFLFAFAVSCVPALVLAWTLEAALEPTKEPQSVLTSIGCLAIAQRWLVVSCLTLIGMGLRGMTRWRLILLANAHDRPTKFPVTIRSFVIMTACVAVGIAVFKTLKGPDVGDGPDPYVWSIAFGLGIAEVLSTLLFLVLPVVVSFASKHLRRFLHLGIALIGILVTFILASQIDPEASMLGIAIGSSYFSVLVLGLLLAKRWGFRLAHLTREELWQPVTWRPLTVGVAHRRSGWIMAAVLALPYLVVYTNVDARALLMAATSGNTKMTPLRAWNFALATRRVNRIVGESHPKIVSSSSSNGRIPAMQWGGGFSRFVISAMCEFASFEILESPDQSELVHALRGIKLTDFSITAPKISAEHFRALEPQKSLGLLRMKSDVIDPHALRAFCESSDVGMVFFESLPTAETLRALQAAENLHYVGIQNSATDYSNYDTVHFPSAAANVLSSLPIRSLVASYTDSKAFEIDQLDQMTSLRVYASPIDDGFVDAVNSLTSKSNSFEYLTLDRCEISQESVAALSELQANHLTIQWDGDGDLPVDWIPLAQNRYLERLSLIPLRNRYAIDPLQRAKLNVAAGRELIPFLLVEPTGFLHEFLRDAGSVEGTREDIWKQVAHHSATNDRGDLEYLDLTWISLDGQLFDELADMPGLKAIRFSGPPSPYPDASNTKHVPVSRLFQKSNLESIEVPSSDPLTDLSLAMISKLPNLKRLTLPICPSIPNADKIPFPTECLSELQLSDMIAPREQFDESTKAGYDPGLTLTPKGLQLLANCDQLESLVLPGKLLHDRTLTVLESLPKLKQLHLPFSRAKSEQLTRIERLSLNELSIGVDLDMADEAIATLAKSSSLSLDVLQLFVYGEANDEANVEATSNLEAKLKTLLPTTKSHLILLRLPKKDRR